MGIKIDGKSLAKEHQNKLIDHLKKIKSNRLPAIVSFCNKEDPPSVRYTQMKKEKAEEIGINFIVEEYDTTTAHEDLANKVKSYNQRGDIDGIMVQLPLPLDLIVFQGDLLNLIAPEKDVDGLTEEGRGYFLPATVKSVISILNSAVPDWIEKHLGVVGSGGEVGAPLISAFKELGALRIVAVDYGQGELEKDLLDCEVIISATGKENLIKPEMIQDGVDLIDVGLGDFDEACFSKASSYTGKFGGVGPMTVISLMENVVQAFENALKKG